MNPSIREALLGFARDLGVVNIFRRLLIDGNPLPPGTDLEVVLNGHNWYIDRPQKHWDSDMHWVSPSDEEAHSGFLEALGGAGFDEVLRAIGERFDLDGLYIYHLTFIGVSRCNEGYIHHDFKHTDGKAFNVIVPLMLVDGSPPELILTTDDDEDVMGLHKYRYDVGSIVGDYAMHATASCDYRDENGMRLAATIYFADVNDDNVDAVIDSFTQMYPPHEPEFLPPYQSLHWDPNDPSVTLPRGL